MIQFVVWACSELATLLELDFPPARAFDVMRWDVPWMSVFSAASPE